MSDDEPITLAEACNLYPRSRLTVSTLRAEAARGRLTIFRMGKRDYTTIAFMRDMVRRCQDEDYRRDSISMRQEANGLSETDNALPAQAALRRTVVALKQGIRVSRAKAHTQARNRPANRRHPLGLCQRTLAVHPSGKERRLQHWQFVKVVGQQAPLRRDLAQLPSLCRGENTRCRSARSGSLARSNRILASGIRPVAGDARCNATAEVPTARAVATPQ